MNAAQHLIPSQSIGREGEGSVLSGVRSQAAFVRTLLDEVERVAPSSAGGAVTAQLVEELARLGCRFLEVASALTAVVDAQTPRRAMPPEIARTTIDEAAE